MHFFSTADLPAPSPRKFDLADGYSHVAFHDDRIRLTQRNTEGEPLDDLTRAVWHAARWTEAYHFRQARLDTAV